MLCLLTLAPPVMSLHPGVLKGSCPGIGNIPHLPTHLPSSASSTSLASSHQGPHLSPWLFPTLQSLSGSDLGDSVCICPCLSPHPMWHIEEREKNCSGHIGISCLFSQLQSSLRCGCWGPANSLTGHHHLPALLLPLQS